MRFGTYMILKQFIIFLHYEACSNFKPETICYFCTGKPLYRPDFNREGKSGQRRTPCFLTGRSLKEDSSLTENNHLNLMYHIVERVKRCGKSAPVPVATSGAVRLTGCKAMYILIGGRCCGTARLSALFLFAQGSQEG